jgi:hypothetical protein
VRRAAAGGDKPARVSSWARADPTILRHGTERVGGRGFRGGDDGARDRRSQPGSAGDGRDRRCGWEVWCRLGAGADLRFRL